MPFTDSLSLGPAPAEENPAQVGDPDYADRALKECRRYVAAIRKVCGDEPEGAQLRVKRESHDYGDYYEVEVRFDGSDKAAAEYAAKVDAHAPTTWEAAGMGAAFPPDQGKVYRVKRGDSGVTVTVEHGAESYPLPPRNDLRDHSPDGYNFGYSGSGPAQLSLALCCDALADDRLALRVYQAVRGSLVAKMDGDSVVIAQAAVLESARAASEGRSR